jgi:hypothetical protein
MGLFSIFKKKKKNIEEKEDKTSSYDEHQNTSEKEPVNN